MEPTPETVERVARAFFGALSTADFDEALNPMQRENWLNAARAALESLRTQDEI